MGIDSDAAISRRLVCLYRRIALEGSVPRLSVLRGRAFPSHGLDLASFVNVLAPNWQGNGNEMRRLGVRGLISGRFSAIKDSGVGAEKGRLGILKSPEESYITGG
jgi:hypothetical protein